MEKFSACGSLEGRVGSMKLASLFCGTFAALRHRVYYRNDVRMEQNRRADAGRRCLGLLAQCPTLHFTKLQHKARVRWAGILTPHSFEPVQNSGLQAEIFLPCM